MRVTWGDAYPHKGRIMQFVSHSHDSTYAVVLEDWNASWGPNSHKGRFVKVQIHELIPDPPNRN